MQVQETSIFNAEIPKEQKVDSLAKIVTNNLKEFDKETNLKTIEVRINGFTCGAHKTEAGTSNT